MPKVGSSGFTHRDDAKTPIHPSNPDHFDSLHYGDDVPDRNELNQVVLGPPPFGSPDPRTLGHNMLHPVQGKPASAPELDDGFKSLEKATRPKTQKVTDKNDDGNDDGTDGDADEDNEPENYENLSKAELLDLASERDLDVKESNTKAEIIDALEESDADGDDDQ